jgi:hypothetical protein
MRRRGKTMVLGPLEYLVVGFENYRFTGQILAELRAAQEQGIIRVLDLCVIAKDELGNVTERELSELSGEEASALRPLARNVMALLAEERANCRSATPASGAATSAATNVSTTRVSATCSTTSGLSTACSTSDTYRFNERADCAVEAARSTA